MADNIIVSAPGKLHLLGEHAVVYGKPAIIAAVNKRCYVTISPRHDKNIVVPSENVILSENIIFEKTNLARKQWQEFIKTGESMLLKNITKNPIDFVLIAIGETLQYYNKKISSGFALSVQSDIPLGSGMGSSAAFAVSLAGAMSLFLGESLNKEKINEIAFRIEQIQHGNPSGGDNTASCYGGFIWYQKKSDTEKIIKPFPYSISKNIAEKFFIINTGIPEESTGEMVTMVNSKFKVQSSKFEKIFADQERLVNKLLSIIQNEDITLMIYIIRVGEKNLEKLGVVSESTKQLIRQIEESGGAAKICGAGGRKNKSGIVLAFHENPDMIKQISKQYHLACERIILGEEGVRRENE